MSWVVRFTTVTSERQNEQPVKRASVAVASNTRCLRLAMAIMPECYPPFAEELTADDLGQGGQGYAFSWRVLSVLTP